jgi:hypothetical protein
MGLSNRTRMPPPALSAKRIDSPSMMRGSPARSGRLCTAITARGRSDSMVSRAVIESRRRPVPDPRGGPQPRPLRPRPRPGRSRRDVGGPGSLPMVVHPMNKAELTIVVTLVVCRPTHKYVRLQHPLFGRRARSGGSTSARRPGLHHRPRATPDHTAGLVPAGLVAAPHIARSLSRVMLDTTRPSPDSVSGHPEGMACRRMTAVVIWSAQRQRAGRRSRKRRPPRTRRPATANRRSRRRLAPTGGPPRQGEQLGPGQQLAGQGHDLAPKLVVGEPLQMAGSAARCPWRSGSGPRSGPGGGAAVPGPRAGLSWRRWRTR